MTAESHTVNLQCHFSPGWRMHIAEGLVSGTVDKGFAPDDPLIAEACQYLRARVADPGKAADAYPHLQAAATLQANPAACNAAKILVLGGCPRPEIATLLNLDEAALAAWETLHFDVRAHPKAEAWVAIWTIHREEACGNYALAAQMSLAIALGPLAAKAVLNPRSALSSSPNPRIVDSVAAMQMKMSQALLTPLDTTQDTLRYLRMAMEFERRGDRLELDSRKLELRAEDTRRRQAAAEARAERRAQQEAQREEAHRQKQRDKERRERQQQELLLAKEAAFAERRRIASEQAAQSSLAQLCWEGELRNHFETECTPPSQPTIPVPIGAPQNPKNAHEAAA